MASPNSQLTRVDLSCAPHGEPRSSCWRHSRARGAPRSQAVAPDLPREGQRSLFDWPDRTVRPSPSTSAAHAAMAARVVVKQ